MDSNYKPTSLRELLPKSLTDFVILEDAIEGKDLQEFIEFKRKNKISDDTNLLELLASQDIENQKIALVNLVDNSEVEVFRALEGYYNSLQEDNQLKEWAKYTMMRCKISMENSLLGTNKIPMASGLGAKNGKIRFFALLFKEDKSLITESEQKVISNELNFQARELENDIEQVTFNNYYFSVVYLCSLKYMPTLIFEKLSKEMKELGLIISPHMMINNVKIMNDQEINNFFERVNQSDDIADAFSQEEDSTIDNL